MVMSKEKKKVDVHWQTLPEKTKPKPVKNT